MLNIYAMIQSGSSDIIYNYKFILLPYVISFL